MGPFASIGVWVPSVPCDPIGVRVPYGPWDPFAPFGVWVPYGTWGPHLG